MFASKEENAGLSDLLDSWTNDPQDMKAVFLKLSQLLMEKEHTILTFKARPGVSYSLRAASDSKGEHARPLFVMVDVIDDDPDSRWLSVCFYGDMITDPDEEGDFVPEGLLGEDGHCFDLYEPDQSMVSYIGQRIHEAHAWATSPE